MTELAAAAANTFLQVDTRGVPINGR